MTIVDRALIEDLYRYFKVFSGYCHIYSSEEPAKYVGTWSSFHTVAVIAITVQIWTGGADLISPAAHSSVSDRMWAVFCANSTIPELEQSGYKGKPPINIYTSALALCTFTSHSLWNILVLLVEEKRLKNSKPESSSSSYLSPPPSSPFLLKSSHFSAPLSLVFPGV